MSDGNKVLGDGKLQIQTSLKAFKEGLSFARHIDILDAMLEGDCLTVVKLTVRKHSLSYIHSLYYLWYFSSIAKNFCLGGNL